MQDEISRFLGSLSEDFEAALVGELEARSMVMHVRAGDHMLNVGQTIRAVPLVVSGTMNVSRVNDRGQELLLYYVRPGESCAMTFNCCMLAQASVIRASAEEDSTLLCIPVGMMDDWMTRFPTWKRYVMTTILNRFSEVLKCIDEVAFMKTDDRLVRYLKEKSRVTGSSLINLTHQQIADEMGSHRVMISRLLKKLETDKKLLLFRNQIKLLGDL